MLDLSDNRPTLTEYIPRFTAAAHAVLIPCKPTKGVRLEIISHRLNRWLVENDQDVIPQRAVASLLYEIGFQPDGGNIVHGLKVRV